MKRTRRDFLKSVGVGASALALSGGRLRPWAERLPNIVLIFTDDQGYGDLGCYGAKGFTTPNIDRIAAEGIRFTNFYVSQAVCSASRAALLTGCYSERVGIQGALNPNAVIGLADGEETIASLLKKRGYSTGIFGKWHLGHHREFLPLQHGFDEYFGLPYSNDMWPVGFDGKPALQGQKTTYPPLPLIDGNEKVEEVATLADQDMLTTRYTERAVRFIEKNKDKPFFLYLPHSMPHVPLGVSGKFRGKSAQGKYGDVIMEIDWSVGEVLKTLVRLGLDDDTLVIYASDNGPWLNFGNHAGMAGPLREGKGTMWEGGARVPCVMRFPGRIPAAQVCTNIASTIDILPTIAAMTGSPLSGNRIDGVDISSLLTGVEGANPRDHFFYYYGGELQAVCEGKWKLHFPHRYRSYAGVAAGNDGQPGPYATGETGLELYDLESDIGESVNVAGKHPDVVERLTLLGKTAREELGDKLTNTIGRGVREPGRKGALRKKTVQHLGAGKKIRLKNRFAAQYRGGSEQALLDGIRGTPDHQDGTWQGFEGVDLEADIDLGTIERIQKITCGFLESQASWIFLPSVLEVATSRDAVIFEKAGAVQLTPDKPNSDSAVRDISISLPAPVEARVLRVKAMTIGTCPVWHAGAGGKAWLFSDEIIIE